MFNWYKLIRQAYVGMYVKNHSIQIKDRHVRTYITDFQTPQYNGTQNKCMYPCTVHIGNKGIELSDHIIMHKELIHTLRGDTGLSSCVQT